MIEVTGLHNCAKCFCETIEGTAREQIQAVCDREEFATVSYTHLTLPTN